MYYAAFALDWVVCARLKAQRNSKLFECAVPAPTITAGVLLISIDLNSEAPWENGFLMLLFSFFSGATYYLLCDRIVLACKFFWPLLAVLVLSALDKYAFFAAYLVTLGYLVRFLAYVPSGAVRHYNRFGNFSYGIYIYGFPAQQSIAALGTFYTRADHVRRGHGAYACTSSAFVAPSGAPCLGTETTDATFDSAGRAMGQGAVSTRSIEGRP